MAHEISREAILYGASQQACDDARLVVQIAGTADNTMEMAHQQGLFVLDGPKCRAWPCSPIGRAVGGGVRIRTHPSSTPPHRAVALWKDERRTELVRYLSERELVEDARFWKLDRAVFEVLPRGGEDWKRMNALFGEREILESEARQAGVQTVQQELRFERERG